MSKPNQAWRCSVIVEMRAARSSSAHYAFHKRPMRGNVPARIVFGHGSAGESQARTAGGVCRNSCSAPKDDLRMHVLGEPVGRQLMAEAALLRLAVDEGAGGGELIAEADIVDEASDVSVRLAALDSTGDELRQGRKLVEVDLLRQLPAAAHHLLLDHDVLGGDVNRAGVVPVNDDAVGALDGLDLDFRPFDRAQMHPRLDPALEKNVVD